MSPSVPLYEGVAMKILEPLDINRMTIPNRIMVPAMVTRLSGEDGYVNDDIIDRYVRYAEGGVGLIVVEAMAVHGVKSGPLLRISGDEFVPGLSELTRRIHDTSDSKVVPQIIHFLKIARSGWRQTVEMLSRDDIETIISQFGDAVARAREAGFDGAELHAAHAYTLSSFLSRRNTREDEYGGTLENRLHLLDRVMADVRRKAGSDFPVGTRFVAEECIKGGYTIEESELIALRMAQLGVDYISLTVGGKFEDAEHREGRILYPYTGYSGERAMPDAWYPAMLNVPLSARIRSFLREHGQNVPIGVAGKISDPADAERILADGSADFLAIARQLLADPDWTNKVRAAESDRIVLCDYCNVCKALDGDHKKVICVLWPKGALHAPSGRPTGDAPRWGSDGGGLGVSVKDGEALLRWNKAEGPAVGYDVFRADDGEPARCVEAAQVRRWPDRTVIAGRHYRYFVRAFDSTGRQSPPSNTVEIDLQPTKEISVDT
jgi:2,4-dienoyl-CoA reductase-like NADH-dependent reductase (Old Yellow Enzyme family)